MFTGHAHVTTHQCDQLLANHQAQPCATGSPGRTAVQLVKGLKQLAHLLGGYAHAGIGHSHPQHHSGTICAQHLGTDTHAAIERELDGVVRQVDQHLGQPHRVTQQAIGHLRIGAQGELQALGARLLAHDGVHLAQHIGPGKRNRLYFDLASLDLREIKHVIHDALKVLSRLADAVYMALLALVQPRLQGKVAADVDGAQRRANFVAHVRQKLTFGLVGLVGLLLEFQQSPVVGSQQGVTLFNLGQHEVDAHREHTDLVIRTH